MENEGGRQYFSQSFDNDELKKSAKETVDIIKNVGDKAVAEGARIDKAYKKAFEGVTQYGINSKNELIEAIDAQKQAIAKLEEQYGKVNAAFYNVKIPENPDDAFIEQRQKAMKLLSESKIELDREKNTLGELEKAYYKLQEAIAKSNNEQKPEKISTYRTQIMQLTDEMARMRDSGQKDTDTYRQLEEELKRIGTAFNEANKEKRLLTTGENAWVQGMISGISGIAGAFSAAQGVSSLFIKNNEQLAVVQTKLQSAMAITIGLQQISTTLHQTSAFRMNILTKATDFFTGSTNRLSVALGISNIAAKVLMATLTLGLSVAIGAIIYLWDKFSTEASKAKKAAEEFNKVVAETAAEPIAAINKLAYEWNKLGDDLQAKEKFVKDNKKAFEDLGYSVRSVYDAEKLLVDNKEAFISAQIAKAKAVVYAKQAQDKVESMTKKQQKLDSGVQLSWWQPRFMYSDDKAYEKAKGEKKTKLEADIKKDNQEIEDLFTKAVQSESEAFRKSSEIEVNKVNEYAAGAIGALEKAISEKREKLKHISDPKEGQKITKEIEAFQKQIDNITGKKDKDKSNNRETRDRQRQLDAERRLTEIERQQALERERFDLDMRQREIDSMDDSFAKKIKQLKLNQEKELQSIREFEQSKVKEQQKIEEEQWKSEGKVGLFKPTTLSFDQLPENVKKQAEQMGKAADDAFISGMRNLNKDMGELLRQQEVAFKSTLDKELSDLDANYSEQIAKAEGNEKLITLLRENHAKARKEAIIKNRLSELDFNEELEIERAKGLESISMTELAEEKKLEIQRKYITLRIEALKKLADAGDEDALKQVDLLNEKLKNLEVKKPLSLKSLGDKAIFDAIKRNFENLGDSAEEAEEKTIKLLSAIKNTAGTIANVVGELKSAFGGLDEGLDEVLDTVGNIANGFAQGGIVGGAMAIISEGVKLLNKASEAEKRHQEALREIVKDKLAMQRQYNLALLEQNLLLKEATTIFGEKEITKAAKSVQVYAEAINSFKKELKGEAPVKTFWNTISGEYKKQMDAYTKGIGSLYQITTKTGHEKTGLFGWGSGRDIYTPILKQYDDLLTSEGKLNVERAKTILNTQTMSDENKSLLQSLIDLQEAADKAQDALRDYLKETFGSLGSELMNSIASSIRDEGMSAWEDFGKAGSKVIEKLGEQLAYELFFSDKFKKLQENLEAIYGQTGKTPEDIAKDAMNLVGDFYNNVETDMDAAKAFMENWQKEAGKRGFDLWQNNNEDERKASQKGLASISQDSANELNGSFAIMRTHTFEINENVKIIVASQIESAGVITDIKYGMNILTANSERILNHLAGIEDNTKYCENLVDINKNIVSMKYGIDDMNLKGVLLRKQ